MPTNHIYRINDDIRRVLSSLLRQVKDPRINQEGLLSVVRADTARDLQTCKVYLSFLGDLNEKEFRRGLQSCSGWLRHELGSALSLRHTPELQFEIDKSMEYGAHINRLLDGLAPPHDTAAED